jgi:hypothetical protein
MRRRLISLLALVSLILGAQALVAPAAVAHPYCGQVWGSLPKSAGGLNTSAGTLVNIRAGRHACFDRLVLDINAPLTAWSVRYVDALHQPGSGDVVPVHGGARLEVTARVPVIPTDAFFLPDGTLINTTGFRTFRHVAWVGSFESVSVVGLGVRARLPFRAFVLPGPGEGSRLVVDVGHRWCAPGHVRC